MLSQKSEHELGSLVAALPTVQPEQFAFTSRPHSLCVINCRSPREGNIQKSAPRQCIAEA